MRPRAEGALVAELALAEASSQHILALEQAASDVELTVEHSDGRNVCPARVHVAPVAGHGVRGVAVDRQSEAANAGRVREGADDVAAWLRELEVTAELREPSDPLALPALLSLEDRGVQHRRGSLGRAVAAPDRDFEGVAARAAQGAGDTRVLRLSRRASASVQRDAPVGVTKPQAVGLLPQPEACARGGTLQVPGHRERVGVDRAWFRRRRRHAVGTEARGSQAADGRRWRELDGGRRCRRRDWREHEQHAVVRRHAARQCRDRAEVGRRPHVTRAPLLRRRRSSSTDTTAGRATGATGAGAVAEQLGKVEADPLRHVGAVDGEQRDAAAVQRLRPDRRRRARVAGDLDAAELAVAQRAVGRERPLVAGRRLRHVAVARRRVDERHVVPQPVQEDAQARRAARPAADDGAALLDDHRLLLLLLLLPMRR